MAYTNLIFSCQIAICGSKLVILFNLHLSKPHVNFKCYTLPNYTKKEEEKLLTFGINFILFLGEHDTLVYNFLYTMNEKYR